LGFWIGGGAGEFKQKVTKLTEQGMGDCGGNKNPKGGRKGKNAEKLKGRVEDFGFWIR
jgi:hypothetical protein